MKNVLLPPLLLETAIALLSFHREDAKPTPELKARYVVYLFLVLFCELTNMRARARTCVCV